MYYTYNDKRTDREKELEYELERERDQRERERRQENEEREARRQEQREHWQQMEREADNWPEAFRKQARLCWQEHNAFPEQNDEDPFFGDSAKANEKALEFWREVSASKQAQLDELQKQIDAVWESVRLEVADKVEAISDHLGYKSTAQAIRDNDLDRYLDW
jgi:hypothetical protein